MEIELEAMETELEDGAETKEVFKIEDVFSDETMESFIAKVEAKIKKLGRSYKDFTTISSGRNSFDGSFPPPTHAFDAANDCKWLEFDGDTALTTLLSYNKDNRPILLKKLVDRVVDMVSGEWLEETSQGIAFSKDPYLLDGQYRLLSAYISSKIVPNFHITLFVIFNRPFILKEKCDSNTTREDHDIITMKMKSIGKKFINDKYNGISIKDIKSLIKAMPGNGGWELDKIERFCKEHIDELSEFLKVAKSSRTLKYSAAWAAPFGKAWVLFGKDAISPLILRLVTNAWIYTKETNRIDPLLSLYNKIVNNYSAGPSSKLGATAIKSMSIYALRKALLAEQVSENRGSRHFAKFLNFTQEEVDDYKIYKNKSKLLKKNSVARADEKRKNKDRGEDDADEVDESTTPD